jgi:glycosyltransferase involved in cell wall biosynthesis
VSVILESERSAQDSAPPLRLPRVLLLSDCTAEASVSGQLLLYRLLQSCDPGELTVIEGDMQPSSPARRLPGVAYDTIHYKPWRFESRLYPYWNTYLLWGIRRWLQRVMKVVRENRIEAVLTVAHGHLWLLAADVARRAHLPLHVIIHDDWPSFTQVAPGFRAALQRQFEAVYAQAASRLCVSPFMEAEYRKRYGHAGTVLLPSRAPDMPAVEMRVRERNDPFTLAFAGSISNADYSARLRCVADAVSRVGGVLELYTNAAPDQIAAGGLARSDVRCAGFVPSRDLVGRLGATADALFLPMSFLPEDRAVMEVCFPSKLADYTAVGLPILIWGPEYSAAARWANDNPGVALCVTDANPESLAAAVKKLATDYSLRQRLAAAALAVGEQQFGAATATAILRSCLLRGQPRTPQPALSL